LFKKNKNAPKLSSFPTFDPEQKHCLPCMAGGQLIISILNLPRWTSHKQTEMLKFSLKIRSGKYTQTA
jgi:hypothetical protein